MEDKSYHKALNTGVSDGSHSGNRGVTENYRRKARVQEEANKLGDTIMAGVAGLFLHPVFCFLGFWIAGFGGLMALASVIGISTDNGPPAWYGWTAAVIPVVLAVLLRKFVHKIMTAAFVAIIVFLVILMAIQVTELREERATQQVEAPPKATASAKYTAPRKTLSSADVQRALIDARTPEVTSTPPSEGPSNVFENAYCTPLPADERPDWCP